MQDTQVKFVMILLLAIQVFPFFITHLLVSGFEYANEDERDLVIRWSLPINLVANSVVLALTFAFLFRGHSSIFQLARMEGSYQDASRLALCSVICASFSAAAAVGGVLAFFRGNWQEMHLSRRGWARVFLLVSVLIVPQLLGIAVSRSGIRHLAITAYCRKTISYLPTATAGDTEEDKGSYVVIRNNGEFTVEAEGLHLSDDDRRLDVLRLDDAVLGAGESFRQNITGDQSLDVKKDGGTIVFLSDSDGMILDSVMIPALKQEEVYLHAGDEWSVVRNLSAIGNDAMVAPPMFSVPGGFYDEGFELILTSEPGTTIYYTLDCSVPTPESERYSKSIHVYNKSGEPDKYLLIPNVIPDYLNNLRTDKQVDKCFVVRAIAVDSSGNASDVATASYFVNLSESYGDDNVISLVTDPDNLFNDETGIMVTGPIYDRWYKDNYLPEGTPAPPERDYPYNFRQKGLEWERPASMELYVAKEPIITQNVGIRIQGNSSRNNLAKKRFSIFSRKEYSGSEYFDKNIINDYKLHSVYTRAASTPNDLFCQNLGTDLNLLTRDYIMVQMFVDGEYWYNVPLHEKYSSKNIAEKFGLHKENVAVVIDGEIDDLSATTGTNGYNKTLKISKGADYSSPEVFDDFTKKIDINSFVDYVCLQAFVANIDLNSTHNTIVWHTIIPENDGFGDGRWRWGIVDGDLWWAGYEKYTEKDDVYNYNPFSPGFKTSFGNISDWPIYAALRKNETFVKQITQRFQDLLNTSFSVKSTLSLMDRAGIDSEVLRVFLEKRPAVLFSIVANEFGQNPVLQKITIKTDKTEAKIDLNSISLKYDEIEQEVPETMPWEAWKQEYTEPLPPVYRWEGQYFTDYPVTVSTEEPDFLRWEVTSGGQTTTYADRTIEVPVVEGGVEIHAVFK